LLLDSEGVFCESKVCSEAYSIEIEVSKNERSANNEQNRKKLLQDRKTTRKVYESEQNRPDKPVKCWQVRRRKKSKIIQVQCYVLH
jgi:hypothetical protein